MKTINFISLSGLLFLVACGDNLKKSTIDDVNPLMPYIVDIESNLRNEQSIPISIIGKELEYIPLETNSKSILGRIDEFIINDSYIFISDFNKLLQFDINGKFIRQVGANGRGPGEYIHVSGFCIDAANNRIYILAWGAYKVLEFDYDGRFLRFFKLQIDTGPLETNQFLKDGTDSFVFVLPNFVYPPQGSENILIITDTVGTPIAKIKNYNKGLPNSLRKSKVPMFYHMNTIRILEDGVDTLKTLEHGNLKPYAILNLGKIKMDLNTPVPNSKNWIEEYGNLVRDKLQIWEVNENEQYLFMKLVYGISDSFKFGIFNKKSLETVFIDQNGFENNLDGGLPFWPRVIYNDSIMIENVDAITLINHVKSSNSVELRKKYGEKFLRLEKLSSELDEISNPVLVVLK